MDGLTTIRKCFAHMTILMVLSSASMVSAQTYSVNTNEGNSGRLSITETTMDLTPEGALVGSEPIRYPSVKKVHTEALDLVGQHSRVDRIDSDRLPELLVWGVDGMTVLGGSAQTPFQTEIVGFQGNVDAVAAYDVTGNRARDVLVAQGQRIYVFPNTGGTPAFRRDDDDLDDDQDYFYALYSWGREFQYLTRYDNPEAASSYIVGVSGGEVVYAEGPFDQGVQPIFENVASWDGDAGRIRSLMRGNRLSFYRGNNEVLTVCEPPNGGGLEECGTEKKGIDQVDLVRKQVGGILQTDVRAIADSEGVSVFSGSTVISRVEIDNPIYVDAFDSDLSGRDDLLIVGRDEAIIAAQSPEGLWERCTELTCPSQNYLEKALDFDEAGSIVNVHVANLLLESPNDVLVHRESGVELLEIGPIAGGYSFAERARQHIHNTSGDVHKVLSGDLNGDHLQDVAVLSDAGLHVYWGSGADRTHMWSGQEVLDGDVIESQNPRENGLALIVDGRARAVFFNDGNTVTRTLGVNDNPVQIQAIDANNDSRIDVLVLDDNGVRRVRRSSSKFGFRSPQTWAEGSFQAFAGGDFSGDGWLELITATSNGARIWSGRNDAISRGDRVVDGSYHTIVAKSMSFNKTDDVLFVGDSTSVVIPSPDGSMFENSSPADVGLPGYFLLQAHLADLNGNALYDLVGVTDDGRIGLHSNNGSVQFPIIDSQEDELQIDWGDRSPTMVSTGDVNNNGLQDLIVVLDNGDVEIVYNNRIEMSLMSSDAQRVSQVSSGIRGDSTNLQVGDVNGDGQPNFFVSHGDRIAVALTNRFNDPSGNISTDRTLLSAGQFQIPEPPASTAHCGGFVGTFCMPIERDYEVVDYKVLDLNRNGYSDLIVAYNSPTSSLIATYYNTRDRERIQDAYRALPDNSSQIHETLNSNIDSLTLSDLNGNGRPDVFVTRSGTSLRSNPEYRPCRTETNNEGEEVTRCPRYSQPSQYNEPFSDLIYWNNAPLGIRNWDRQEIDLPTVDERNFIENYRHNPQPSDVVPMPEPPYVDGESKQGALLDYTGNGHPDLIACSSHGDLQYLIPNNGDRSFGSPVHYDIDASIACQAVDNSWLFLQSADGGSLSYVNANDMFDVESLGLMTGNFYVSATGDYNQDGRKNIVIRTNGGLRVLELDAGEWGASQTTTVPVAGREILFDHDTFPGVGKAGVLRFDYVDIMEHMGAQSPENATLQTSVMTPKEDFFMAADVSVDFDRGDNPFAQVYIFGSNDSGSNLFTPDEDGRIQFPRMRDQGIVRVEIRGVSDPDDIEVRRVSLSPRGTFIEATIGGLVGGSTVYVNAETMEITGSTGIPLRNTDGDVLSLGTSVQELEREGGDLTQVRVEDESGLRVTSAEVVEAGAVAESIANGAEPPSYYEDDPIDFSAGLYDVTVNSDGYLITIDGKQVVGPNGEDLFINDGDQIVDAGGVPVLSAGGDALFLASDGTVVTSDDQVSDEHGLGFALGGLATDANNQLIDEETGQPIINSEGRPIYVDDDGILVDDSGDRLISGGLTQSVDEGGWLIDDLGQQVVDLSRRLFSASNGHLVDADGSVVELDDQPLEVDSSSYLLASDGTELISLSGSTVRLNSDGNLVNDDGRFLTEQGAGQYKTLDNGFVVLDDTGGKVDMGDYSLFMPATQIAASGALVGPNGEAIKVIDGRDVFVDPENGRLLDQFGNYLENGDGKVLVRNGLGDIVVQPDQTSDGFLVFDGFTDSTSPIPGVTVDSQGRLIGPNGEPVRSDGEFVYVDPVNGYVVDSHGNPIRNDIGEPFYVEDGTLKTDFGVPANDTGLVEISGEYNVTGRNELVRSDGQFLYAENGEQVYVDRENTGHGRLLIDRDGNPVLDGSGMRMYLNAKGEVVNENGESVGSLTLAVQPSSGNGTNNDWGLSFNMTTTAMIDGWPVYINGNKVLITENGTLIEPSEANPITFRDAGVQLDTIDILHNGIDHVWLSSEGHSYEPDFDMLDRTHTAVVSFANEQITWGGEALVFNGVTLETLSGHIPTDERGTPLTMNNGNIENIQGQSVPFSNWSDYIRPASASSFQQGPTLLVTSNNPLVCDSARVLESDNGWAQTDSGSAYFDGSNIVSGIFGPATVGTEELTSLPSGWSNGPRLIRSDLGAASGFNARLVRDSLGFPITSDGNVVYWNGLNLVIDTGELLLAPDGQDLVLVNNRVLMVDPASDDPIVPTATTLLEIFDNYSGGALSTSCAPHGQTSPLQDSVLGILYVKTGQRVGSIGTDNLLGAGGNNTIRLENGRLMDGQDVANIQLNGVPMSGIQGFVEEGAMLVDRQDNPEKILYKGRPVYLNTEGFLVSRGNYLRSESGNPVTVSDGSLVDASTNQQISNAGTPLRTSSGAPISVGIELETPDATSSNIDAPILPALRDIVVREGNTGVSQTIKIPQGYELPQFTQHALAMDTDHEDLVDAEGLVVEVEESDDGSDEVTLTIRPQDNISGSGVVRVRRTAINAENSVNTLREERDLNIYIEPVSRPPLFELSKERIELFEDEKETVSITHNPRGDNDTSVLSYEVIERPSFLTTEIHGDELRIVPEKGRSGTGQIVVEGSNGALRNGESVQVIEVTQHRNVYSVSDGRAQGIGAMDSGLLLAMVSVAMIGLIRRRKVTSS